MDTQYLLLNDFSMSAPSLYRELRISIAYIEPPSNLLSNISSLLLSSTFLSLSLFPNFQIVDVALHRYDFSPSSPTSQMWMKQS